MDDENKKLYGYESEDTDEAIEIDFGDDIFIDLDDDETFDEAPLDAPGADDEETPAPNEAKAPINIPEEKIDSSFDSQFFGDAEKDKKSFKKSVIIIACFVVAALLLTIFAYSYTHNKLKDNHKIYSGVLVNGYDLGGMTQEEAAAYITKTYFDPINNAKLTINFEDSSDEYPLTDFVKCPDAQQIARTAYNIGRTGSDSEKVAKIKSLETKKESLLVEYEIVTDKLSDVIKKAEEKGYAAPVDPTYTLKSDCVEFTAGKKGLSINLSQFKSDINDVIVKFENDIANIGNKTKFENASVDIQLVDAEFTKLNADVILNNVFHSSSGAKYVRNGSKLTDDIVVEDGTQGRTLDIDKLNEIVNKINNCEAEPYMTLPYKYVDPEDSKAQLEERLYADVLSYLASENVDDAYSDDGGMSERAVNMELVCEKIGTIQLLGGEYLNIYNFLRDITPENGFVSAQENVINGGTKVVGGGISQVLSTLYEAALKAGLTVDNASHNKYMPCFGTPGFDATYSGGSNALTIRNTTGNPLKITLAYEDGSVVVAIEGNKNAKTSAKLSSELEKNEISGKDLIYSYATSVEISGTEAKKEIVSYVAFGAAVRPDPTPTEEPEPSETPNETPAEGTPVPQETNNPE